MNRFKVIISSILMCGAIFSLHAQERVALPEFHSIIVEADMELELVAVKEGDTSSFDYLLGDNDAERFKFEVNDGGEFVIRQNYKSMSVRRVRATLYYRDVNRIDIKRADVHFATPYCADIADLSIGEGARLSGRLECRDVYLTAITSSIVDLDGEVKYMTLRTASEAKVSLQDVDVSSIDISASQSSIVGIKAGERVVVNTSTAAVVKYWGEPEILRSRSGFIGGQLIKQD